MSLRKLEKSVRMLRKQLVGVVKGDESVGTAALLANSVTMRAGNLRIRWCFPHEQAMHFSQRFILPWAMPEARPLMDTMPVDVTVGLYLSEAQVTGSFADLTGRKFILSGELETRHPRIERALSFVQGPQPADDLQYVRYAPIMCFWAPPLEPSKTKRCSVVDSGRYGWRVEMIKRLTASLGEVDVFGALSGKPLPGYHGAAGSKTGGNDKYLGIQDYCFYLALERAIGEDYLTEKFADAILCEAVPIYRGAANIALYAYAEAYITVEEAMRMNWIDWLGEYDRRKAAVKAQKEFFRRRLNVFSYFMTLAKYPSLLAESRPITLKTHVPGEDV